MSNINEQLDALERKAAVIGGASWVKFPTVGDSFQGTLITRRLAMSPTQQEQIVYVFKNDDGIWNVAFKSSYPIHKEFEKAVVGQVVKVIFSSEKKHQKAGFNPIKIYTVITSADLMDESSKPFLEENGYVFGEALPELAGLPTEEEDEEVKPAAKPLNVGVTHAK